MKHKTKPGVQKQREKSATARTHSPVSGASPSLWLVLGILLVSTLVAYLPTTLQNGFTNWDDLEYVVENPFISLNWDHLPQLLTRPVACNIHPVTMFSLGI